MILLALISCFSSRVLRTGYVDQVENKICNIEFENGENLEIKSSICNNLKEGDTIKISLVISSRFKKNTRYSKRVIDENRK